MTTRAPDIDSYFKKKAQSVDAALDRVLPREKDHPAVLSQAMRYAVFSGGKRIRPVFALAACEAVGGRSASAMDVACALELVHSYSLAHDDLPCMDDDRQRRGKPSCHVKFGEATALLAGDALLTLAFRVLAKGTGDVTAIQWMAEAVGHQGMVGGQALDMEYQEREMDLPTAEYINTHKCGALIALSTRLGARLGGGRASQVECLYKYGKYAGLLFQLTDDIMDDQGYARVLGQADAREEAQSLLGRAKEALRPLGTRARRLEAIADFVAHRDH